jgi:ribosome-binding protein aMBF1 (putative translation factor)
VKSQSYMTRALRAQDPRYARILGKLGYGRRDMQARQDHDPEDELKALREQYQDVVGKRPYHGWDAETLKAKIAEAKA